MTRRLWTSLAVASVLLTGCRFGFDARASTVTGDGGDDSPDVDLTMVTASRQLFLGFQFACVINADGSLQCWGENGQNQIGLGPGPDYLAPVVVDPTRAHVRMGLGQDHACTLDASGEIRCWGSDEYGQLGRSLLNCGNGLLDVATEQCDDGGTANLDSCDSQCQLSSVPPPNQPAPVRFDGNRRYRELYTERYTGCAIATDGSLWCWGRNGARQLGVGDNADRGRPTQVLIVAPEVGADDQWTHVALGSDHTCALRTDGSMWCWGGEQYGQLANGAKTIVRERPNLVPGTATWLDIDSGNDYSCGIQSDHSLWCWGINTMYQLGLGDTTDRFVPTQVMAGSFSRVGVGPSSTCALTDAGQAWCWGGNVSGEIGPNPGVPAQTPVAIAGTWIAVEGGAGFTCLMAPNEDVYCMGANTNGRLGDGTGTTSFTPVRVQL